jgi:hypothetical protein
MEDLEKLSDVRLDEGIYDTLASISIKNCPTMDSYSY